MASIGPSISHALDERLSRVESSIQRQISSLEKRLPSFDNYQAVLKSAPDEDVTPVNAVTQPQRGSSSLFDSLCSCGANRLQNHEKSCFRSFQYKKVHTIARTFRIFSLLLHFRLEVQHDPFVFARDLRVYPNFSMRSTVQNDSEGFCLVVETVKAMEGGLPERELQQTLRHCLVGLRKLFEDGKAWPTDINRSGENLLHVRKVVSKLSVRNVEADWKPVGLLWTSPVLCRWYSCSLLTVADRAHPARSTTERHR